MHALMANRSSLLLKVGVAESETLLGAETSLGQNTMLWAYILNSFAKSIRKICRKKLSY